MPEWTDEGQHDPGPTLIELIAWLAVALLFALGLSSYARRRFGTRRRRPPGEG